MANKIRRLEETPVDVFEAIKRARMKLGFVRRHGVRPGAPDESERLPKPKSVKKARSVEHAEESPQAGKEKEDNQYATGEVESQEIHEKLIDITEKAQDILFEAHTVFPLTLFPDTVTVDREKVTIANRSFFRVAVINSTPIADIQSVEVDIGPFFGTVKTTSKYFMNNPREVHFLWRDDAYKMQRLLQGFIIANERGIDITDIEKDDLLILLADLGQGVTD